MNNLQNVKPSGRKQVLGLFFFFLATRLESKFFKLFTLFFNITSNHSKITKKKCSIHLTMPSKDIGLKC